MIIKQLNPEAFEILSHEFQTYIDNNETGGVLCAVYYQDKLVYCNRFGWKDKENKIPIAFNDIFRIYSMTKPITCLAAFFIKSRRPEFAMDPETSRRRMTSLGPLVAATYHGRTRGSYDAHCFCATPG